jgi:hypothetical protein
LHEYAVSLDHKPWLRSQKLPIGVKEPAITVCIALNVIAQEPVDHDLCVELVHVAAQLQQRFPTYYGAAWVALGRIMLTTSLLGECPVAG